jgi:hypothetical protein
MRQKLEKRLLPKLKVRLIMRRAVFCAAALLCSGQVFLRFFGLVVVLFGCLWLIGSVVRAVSVGAGQVSCHDSRPAQLTVAPLN